MQMVATLTIEDKYKTLKNIKMKNSEEYGRYCLETNHGLTIELGNLTYANAKTDALKGMENCTYYDVDYFSWNGEEINLYNHKHTF